MLERKSIFVQFLHYGALAVSAIVVTFPIDWMILVSLKKPSETFVYPITWLPASPTFENYNHVLIFANFARYFLNSAIVASATTILAIAVAAPAAYGFSRFNYRLGHSLQLFFLVTQMFPGILLVIPYFVMMRAFGMLNSYASLILVYTAFALPFCTWMLIGFFRSIPVELDNAALIDGCGRLGAFTRVVLPLASPGLAATALFAFLLAWKEYLFALALTTQKDMYVLTVGLATLFTEVRVEWNDLLAAAVIATIPALIFYAFLERHMVRGLSMGALKG